MPETFVTAPLARKAFELVKPIIREMMDAGKVKRRDFHIVIAAPRTAAEFSIIHEESMGEKAKWEAPFDEIARSKAEISWRTGKSSSYIAHCAPHLLMLDDTIYWGSNVLDELVTAGSGVEPYYDEMFSGMTNLAICALCKQYQMGRSDEHREYGNNFFDGTKKRA